MKEFVSKVGKCYERSSDSTEEADALTLKVSLWCLTSRQRFLSLLNIKPVYQRNALSFVLRPQCANLNEKLDSLLQTLNLEAQAMTTSALTTPPIVEEEVEEEELEEEEDLSEESITELKENETEKGSAHKLFRPREQLVLRANSLKKVLKQIIEQAERSTIGQHVTKTRNTNTALDISIS